MGIESESPITPLDEAAITLREWFLSFVKNGFTENQALKLCANMAMGAPVPEDGTSPE